MWMISAYCIAAASGMVSLWRQFQMLQQNSYFPRRYGGWVKQSYPVEAALESIGFCAATLLYTRDSGWQLALCCAALLAIRLVLCVRQHRQSIKKLVLTSRVKRLFAAAFLVFAALLVLIFALGELAAEICRMVLFALALVTPLAALLAWALTKPFEAAVGKHYINDAKRILKSAPQLTVIGVTGSYGKTGTKFILQRMLSEKYNVVATPQSFNTPMGVVRTVREHLRPETQVFLCEMGAKKRGDVKEICDIVQPRFGLITSVGAQHLDTFHSVENVFKTKFELMDAAGAANTFIYGESAEIRARLDRCAGAVVYGGADAAFRAENVRYTKDGSVFDLILDGVTVPVSTKLLGLNNVQNIVGAAALAQRLGVTANQIRFAVSALKPTEHRLELKSGPNGSRLIDDAYNANPEGSLDAVAVLGAFDGFKKTVITPGLIELGAKEYDCNFALGAAAAKVCDTVILVGENRSKPLADGVQSTGFGGALHIVSSFAEAMRIYAATADEASVVLLENDLPDNYLY